MIDYLKNRRKKYETKFDSWINNKSKPSFLDEFTMDEEHGLLYKVGKPIKESGNKKELKQSVGTPKNEFYLHSIEKENPVLVGARYYKYS